MNNLLVDEFSLVIKSGPKLGLANCAHCDSPLSQSFSLGILNLCHNCYCEALTKLLIRKVKHDS